VLHMIESLLILLNGSYRPVPVYVKKNNQVRGGFNLQLFWPIPLIALLSVGFIDAGAGGISMPDWWPLLRGYAAFPADMTYGLIPVVAILGYGEVSTTRTPRQATRQSASYLFMFSISLLVLSICSSRWTGFLPLAALFSPLGHELVIWLGMREENRKAIYIQPPRGIMILDIVPDTVASNILKSRDVILSVNGEMVNHYYHFQELLSCGWKEISLEIDRQGQVLAFTFKQPPRDMGIIPVPEANVNRYLDLADDNIFSLIRGIKRKLKK